MIGLLETKEETLKFLIKNYLKLSQKKLAEEFEVTEAEMSKIINNHEKKLKNIHLLGFCYLHDIPY
jgi:DNA-binding Xre family transcriptional regulator